MLRQVYEYRARGNAQLEMTMQRAAEKIGKRDESGRLIHHMTQKEFKEHMKRADQVAKKWL